MTSSSGPGNDRGETAYRLRTRHRGRPASELEALDAADVAVINWAMWSIPKFWTAFAVSALTNPYFSPFPAAMERKTVKPGMPNIAARMSTGVSAIGKAAATASDHQPCEETQSSRCCQCADAASSGSLIAMNCPPKWPRTCTRSAAAMEVPRTAHKAIRSHRRGSSMTSAVSKGAVGIVIDSVATNATTAAMAGNHALWARGASLFTKCLIAGRWHIRINHAASPRIGV